MTCTSVLNIKLDRLYKPFREQPDDWDGLFQWAVKNRLTPLLHWRLAREHDHQHVPEWFRQRLKAHYYQTSTRNLWLLQEAETILKRCEEHGLPIIPLKGILLANSLYPDAALRPFSDIDLLINKEHLPAVMQLLVSQGYYRLPELRNQFEEKFTSCVTFIKESALQPVVVELHWHILYFPTYAPAIRIDDFWTNSQHQKINGCKVQAFKPEHQLIHLCLHYYLHGSCYFIWLMDIALLVERYRNRIDWHAFGKTVKKYRIGKVVEEVLNNVKTAFDLEIPEIIDACNQERANLRNIALEAISRNPENTGIASLFNLYFIPKLAGKINFLLSTVFPSPISSRRRNVRETCRKIIGALKEFIEFVSKKSLALLHNVANNP